MKNLLVAAGLLLTCSLSGQDSMDKIDKCPVMHGGNAQQTATSNDYDASVRGQMTPRVGRDNHDWWPNRLDLSVLRQQSDLSNPMGDDFDYREEFSSLDYDAMKKDCTELMTDAQD